MNDLELMYETLEEEILFVEEGYLAKTVEEDKGFLMCDCGHDCCPCDRECKD